MRKKNIRDEQSRQFKKMNCRECGKEDEVNGRCESLLCEDCTLKMLGFSIIKNQNMKNFNYQEESASIKKGKQNGE